MTLAIAAAVVVAMVALLWPGGRLPSYVDAITVVNPHQWDAEADVTGAGRDGWFGMGSVERTDSHTFEQVIDQGEQWVFRFTYGGVDGGELVVPRTELEASGWKVTVPEQFAERMRAAGVGPSE